MLRGISARAEKFQTVTSSFENPDWDLSSEFHQQFNKLQGKTNAIFLNTSAHDETCKNLEIDSTNSELAKFKNYENDFTIENRRLKPYQITEISFLVNLQNSDIKSMILGDDCELGKTVTTLYNLWMNGTRAMKGQTSWRSALIIMPPELLNVWIKKYVRYFFDKFELVIFHAFSTTNKKTNRLQNLIKKSNSKLAQKFERNLNSNCSENATKIILTTYQTWLTQTLYDKTSYFDKIIAFENGFKQNMRMTKNSGKKFCNRFYQLIKKSKTDWFILNSNHVVKLQFYMTDKFRILIADETTAVKNADTEN